MANLRGTSNGEASFWEHPTVRQFAKFCIVGASSTIIDLGLHRLLMFHIGYDGVLLSHRVGSWMLATFRPGIEPTSEAMFQASFTVLKVLPVGLAILNSYYWNRRWTFRAKGREEIHKQIVKFYTIALIGMALNLLISTALFNIVPGHPQRSWAVASLVAMVVVVFWNFFGQKLWTFRKKA